jgi:hypothetical protein
MLVIHRNVRTEAGVLPYKNLALCMHHKGAIVEIFLLSNSCRSGQFLTAMAACAVLSQSAYANGPSAASERHTSIGSTPNIRRDMTQGKAPLISANKINDRIDYTNICIFCHLPNISSHKIDAPPLSNAIQVLPTSRPKRDSTIPR